VIQGGEDRTIKRLSESTQWRETASPGAWLHHCGRLRRSPPVTLTTCIVIKVEFTQAAGCEAKLGRVADLESAVLLPSTATFTL
jgi:hypothetical protein